MSHRTLSTTLRVVAVLVIVAVGAGLVSQAGSQMPAPRGRTEPPSLPGTVVLHFRVDHAGQTLLDMQVRTARPSLMASGEAFGLDGAGFSWRLHCAVETMSNQDWICLHLDQAVLEHKMEDSRVQLSFQAGAILTSGEEKVLFKNGDLTLRVTAVFEPVGS